MNGKSEEKIIATRDKAIKALKGKRYVLGRPNQHNPGILPDVRD